MRGEEAKKSTVGGGGEGGRVRVRVIFQNPNPYKRVDLFAIVSAVRTLPEARPNSSNLYEAKFVSQRRI